jgi:hypothetical protein
MSDWLEQLDEGQLETLLRLFKKANPPPILLHDNQQMNQ